MLNRVHMAVALLAERSHAWDSTRFSAVRISLGVLYLILHTSDSGYLKMPVLRQWEDESARSRESSEPVRRLQSSEV